MVARYCLHAANSCRYFLGVDLDWDLNATDHFGPASHPTRLLYNPHAEAKQVTIDVGPAACDVYDTVRSRFVRRGAAGPQPFTIAPDQVAVFVLVPTNGKIRRVGSRLYSDDVIIDYRSRFLPGAP